MSLSTIVNEWEKFVHDVKNIQISSNIFAVHYWNTIGDCKKKSMIFKNQLISNFLQDLIQ